MNLLHENSLGKTLDAINDALFFEKQIPQDEARRTARWIAGRQGLPTSYAGMFAPTNEDYTEGVRLFTGERISSRVGIGHILGEDVVLFGKKGRFTPFSKNLFLKEATEKLSNTFHCK